jgi:hypothetical protein
LRGDVRFAELKVGDLVLTARGTWKPVMFVSARPYSGPILDMRGGEFVTPGHLFSVHGYWLRADAIGAFPEAHYEGTIWNAHIETEADDDGTRPDTEHSYTLANGHVVHNMFTA